MRRKYNKAVRDRIPQIITEAGEKCKFTSLSDDKFLIEMEKRLSEEVREFLENKSENELADIIEVVYRIAELKGVTNSDLETVRRDKAIKRGVFSRNYYLIETR